MGFSRYLFLFQPCYRSKVFQFFLLNWNISKIAINLLISLNDYLIIYVWLETNPENHVKNIVS